MMRGAHELAPTERGDALCWFCRDPQPVNLPRIDEHLVEPESREQLVRGRRVVATPADQAHGDWHFRLDYILGAHVKEEYVGSTSLLTRAAHASDFAADICIRRRGVDPATGTRYLEELSFTIVDEQSMRDIIEQAEDLSARGVRRVFAIFVEKGEVREWSAVNRGFMLLDPEGALSDSALVRPLLVRELLDPSEADNAVARALLAKNNPVLNEIRATGYKEAYEEGRREGLLTGIEIVCYRLEIELDAEQRARMNELNASDLSTLLDRICSERRLP